MQRMLSLSLFWSGIFHANIECSENDICTLLYELLIEISIRQMQIYFQNDDIESAKTHHTGLIGVN